MPSHWMRRCGFLLAVSIALLSSERHASARLQPDRPELMEESIRARRMTEALHTYMRAHNNECPPDLGSLTPILAGDLWNASPAAKAQAIRNSFLSVQDRGVKIPDNADEQWVEKNSSYSYIGGPGIKLADLTEWNLAIMHLKLDRGIPSEPNAGNPEGRVYIVAFVDSHTETMTRAQAEHVIAESTAIFQALRTGGPLPDSHQACLDMQAIIAATRAYAKAHKDELPPDLGSVLAYVPSDSPRTATPKQRAAVFLSPRAKKGTHIPDEPTPEWVNANASYVYLGSAGALLAAIEDPRNSLLLHGRLDAPMEAVSRRATREGFPVATAAGHGAIVEEEYARWIIEVSRRVVESARTGAPLPDHLNAYRDVRLILQGMTAYAKDHEGRLPPDLGATLAYVLPDSPAKERALVFLSPKAERANEVPAEVTPGWVNTSTSYAYLAGPGIDLKLAREAGIRVLVHGPFTEPFDIRFSGWRFSGVASGTASMYPTFMPVEDSHQQARESKEMLDALRAAK